MELYNQATLVPGYWNKASVDSIDFMFIQDSETAYQLYKTGGSDVMGSQQNGVPAGHLQEVKGNPDFKQATTLVTRYLGFNNQLAPFDKLEVRRAFALAIDKKTLAEKALGGAVTPADRILPAGMPGSDLPIKP
jgi:ABC-type transport system substrate-binding protein